MKTIISKRLASIMPVNMAVKVGGINYVAGVRFSSGMLISETARDYIINIEAREFNYFCYNKNNKVTSWPVSKGDQPANDSGQWIKEGRQEIKPGKYLLLFTEYIEVKTDDNYLITDDETRKKVIIRLCELFADKIKGANEDFSFELSNNISAIYQTEEHPNSGYLLNSCMKHESSYGCSSYSRFYDLVPGLQIMYKMKDNKLLFRALLWTCKDNAGNDVKFIDRVYGTEPLIAQVIDYAQQNGIAYRTFSDSRILLNSAYISLKCKITDKAIEYLQDEGSPYVDTLKFLNGHWLNNTSGEYELTNCDGHAFNNCICSDCGNSLDEDDVFHSPSGEILCDRCFYEYYTICDHCGETINRDDAVNCDDSWYCEDCAERKGYHKCEDCGEWHDDSIYIDGEGYYCEECFSNNFTYCDICETDHRNNEVNNIEVDGDWKNVCDDCKDNLFRCDECGNYFTENTDDNDLCPDCADARVENEKQLTLSL